MVTIFGDDIFNFEELFLIFFSQGKEIELRGITRELGKIKNSNGMNNILEK